MDKQKISLLYKTEEPLCTCDSIYDLSIDRCAEIFCPDAVRRDRFLRVISHPLKNIDNIIYRQQILRDFLELSDLTDELKTIFSRYDKIKSDWLELRSGVRPGSGGNPEALLGHTYTSLKTTAVFPRTIMSFFGAIHESLASHGIRSEGLIRIRDYCEKLINDHSLEQITEIAGHFVYGEPGDYSYNMLFTISEDMKLIDCELSEIRPKAKKRQQEQAEKQYERELEDIELIARRESGETDKKESLIDRILIGLHTKATSAPDKTAICAESSDAVMTALSDALSDIDTVLTGITSNLYDIFHGISAEMQFYDAAIGYCRFASEASLPLLMPRMLPMEEDSTTLRGLRDLFLACEGMSGESIIPNDVSISGETEGMLIRGSNNTGKTVFLRSVGTAQLFAQAGLPVCADDAVMSVKNGIFSHFSAAEEDFTANDTAGRFEGEVRCIANIIDRIKPYSLVLLNETFQTTAYREGSEGMHDILAVFPRLHTKYIFVTHLLELYEKLDPEKVMLMQTTVSVDEAGYSTEHPGKRFTLTRVK